MHRHHFDPMQIDPLQIDQNQNTINPKNTFNRFVIFQTLIDIIYAARIQRNSTDNKKSRFLKNIFLKFTHFSPITPYYDWVESKIQKDTRKNKKDTVLYLFYKGEHPENE